jgi:hypothetical protein
VVQVDGGDVEVAGDGVLGHGEDFDEREPHGSASMLRCVGEGGSGRAAHLVSPDTGIAVC